MAAQHFPEPRFLVDLNRREESMRSFHSYLERQLFDLDRRMNECIEKYALNKPADKLFVGYTPIALEGITAHIQTLFTRCDMMLRVYESELRWMAQQFDLSTLPVDIQTRQADLRQVAREMRVIYVNRVGGNVITAFRRKLLTAHQLPAPQKPSALNDILQKYFGDVMIDPKDFDNDPAAKQLVSLLEDVGQLTGQVFSAKALITALKPIAIPKDESGHPPKKGKPVKKIREEEEQ